MIYINEYDEDVKLVKTGRLPQSRCPVCGAEEIFDKSRTALMCWHTGGRIRIKLLVSYVYKCGSIIVAPDTNHIYIKQSAQCLVEGANNAMEDVI